MSKFFRRFSIAALACTAWCWNAPRVSADEVASDDATRAAARQLGEEGVEAYWAGDNEQAHAKLERAYQLFSAPTLALWSARACVRVGRWVEAAERYREVTRPSSSVDATTQQQAQSEAKQELSELTPRIPSLTVEASNAQPAQVQISLDGASLPTALIGVPRPTNPGKHKLLAVRGAERYEREVELVEGQREVAKFEFAVLPVAAPAVATSTAPPPPPKESSGSVLKPISIVAFSLGGAALITSGVSALVANGKLDDCPNRMCESDEDVQAYDTAKTVATVSLIAGAAFAVTGLVTWLAAPSAEEQREPGLSWGVGPASFELRGAF